MATNGSSSGVVPAVDTSAAAAAPEQAEEFNPLEMLMQMAEEGPPQAAEEPAEPEENIYDKPLEDGQDGYTVYSSAKAAEAALGLDNGGETDQWQKKLTPNQQKGVDIYTGSYYKTMNEWMRKLSTTISDYAKQYLPSLQHALDKFTVHKPIVTHRGMGPEIFGLDKYATPQEIMAAVKILAASGGQVTDLGFTSSSAATGEEFGGSVVLHTQTPAGKGIGAFVAGVSHYGKSENEFLYNSGSHFQILGAYFKDGQVHVNARYTGRDKSTNNAKHITG